MIQEPYNLRLVGGTDVVQQKDREVNIDGNIDTTTYDAGISLERIDKSQGALIASFHHNLIDNLISTYEDRGHRIENLSFSYELHGGVDALYLTKLSVGGQITHSPSESISPKSHRPSLICGQYIYPLRRPIDSQSYRLLSAQLLGEQSIAYDKLERSVHQRFQEIYRKPPHERTSEEKDMWTLLLFYIDYNSYRYLNPEPISLVGRLVARDLSIVQIHWYGGDQEDFDFISVPASLVAAPINSTISARVRRLPDGATDWLECNVLGFLRSDAEVWQTESESIRSLDEVPHGTWPKRNLSHKKR